MNSTEIVEVFLMGVEWLGYGLIIVIGTILLVGIIVSMYMAFLVFCGREEVDCPHRGCVFSDREGYPHVGIDTHSTMCTMVRAGHFLNIIVAFISLSLAVGGIRLLL